MRRLLLALITTGLMSGMCLASENFDAASNHSLKTLNGNNATAMKAGVITVPAGELIRCVFIAPISSESAYAGQEIKLAIVNDFYYNNILIAPAGSTVTGTVIEVSKAKHGSLSGKITMRFTHIYTLAGFDIPISALIRTSDNTGTLIGGKNVGLITSEYPANLESVDASIYVPPYRGARPAGIGAAMATAVETGGGGLLKSIWDKGEEVEIPVNTRMDIVLTQPITITPSEL